MTLNTFTDKDALNERLGESRSCSPAEFTEVISNIIFLTMFDGDWTMGFESEPFQCSGECDLRHCIITVSVTKGDTKIEACGFKATAFDDVEAAAAAYLSQNPILALGALLGDKEQSDKLKEECKEMLGVVEPFMSKKGVDSLYKLLGAHHHSAGRA